MSARDKSEDEGKTWTAGAARSKPLLGRTLELSGSGRAEAAQHYATTKRMLETIRQESGSDAILKRQDLSVIAAQTGRQP